MSDGNGWDEWKNLILYRFDEMGKKFDRIKDAIDALDQKREKNIKECHVRINAVEYDVTRIKIKMSIYGGLVGLIAGNIPELWATLLKLL